MSTRTYSAFRLNLEQQKKRAKELLRAVRAGNPEAVARLAAQCVRPSSHRPVSGTPAWKLADAQLTIARELRFSSWAGLAAHATAMAQQRRAIASGGPAPDAAPPTLHVRCGSDIQETLRQAGFTGDFLEHSVPYCEGPVSAGPDRHERMARFLVDAFPQARGGLVYERELAGLEAGERELEHSAKAYQRVVLWMEHDRWDQLILARLLAAYAGALRPRLLELIVVSEFPGATRFIGLGQLPAEALRGLWASRRPVTAAQLSLGEEVWSALGAESPQRLAALARSGTPALPVMARALHRHLQELPWLEDGLSLTQRLLLQTVANQTTTLNDLFFRLQERDPLTSLTDLGLLHTVDEMLRASEPPLLHTPPPPGGRSFAQQLTITAAGTAVVAGKRDFGALRPPSRWVGGVKVTPGEAGWRWQESGREVIWSG
jgi:hypothetical protein